MPIKIVWNEVSEERYHEMLGAVPPAMMTGGRFLVGEAHDWRQCTVANQMTYTYRAFARHDGKFYEADQPLTIAEFKQAVLPAHVHVFEKTDNWLIDRCACGEERA